MKAVMSTNAANKYGKELKRSSSATREEQHVVGDDPIRISPRYLTLDNLSHWVLHVLICIILSLPIFRQMERWMDTDPWHTPCYYSIVWQKPSCTNGGLNNSPWRQSWAGRESTIGRFVKQKTVKE